MIAALTGDIIIAMCARLLPLEKVRFCLTCRAFARVLTERDAELYADFEPYRLGRRGLNRALALRWRRLGATQSELGAGFAGACAGRHGPLARKLAAQLRAGAPAATIDGALLSLCADGELYELAGWVLGSCPARPTPPGICAAFAAACGQGYLGFAQLAYRALARAGDTQTAQDLLMQGLEAAAGTPRNAHVVAWIEGRLCYLAGLSSGSVPHPLRGETQSLGAA